MNIFQIAWKNIKQNPATAILGTLLTAFGSAILCVLLLSSHQIERQLDNNSRGIDLVVGAKGSPLQLILSSIYHMDNPTGNIPYKDAQELAANPMVRLAVPLALGDNFKGHRIIGTDHSFIDLYGLELAEGRMWEADFEVVVGAETARKNNLKIGDNVVGAHGFSDDGHVHDSHPYTITGILKPAHNVTDRLILGTIGSVWAVHDLHHDHDDHDDHDHDAHHDHGHDHDHHGDHAHHHDHDNEVDAEEEIVLVKSMAGETTDIVPEITAMLIQYRNPSAIAHLPRLVNQSTSMQAASPAFESTRLFSLLGVGIDALQQLAYIIMFMAALSIFVSLYNAFKNRKYDLAIMRSMGASRVTLFGIVIAEGVLITLIGSILGLVLAHVALHLIGSQTQNDDVLDALSFHPHEGWIIAAGVLIGFVSAVIPAIKAYRTDISQTLSES